MIVKGYPGTRAALTGPRYLTTRPKIVKLAMGRAGSTAQPVLGSITGCSAERLIRGAAHNSDLEELVLAVLMTGAVKSACDRDPAIWDLKK